MLTHRIWAGSSGSGRPRNGPDSMTSTSAARRTRVAQEPADVGVDPAAFLDRDPDGGEVVVGEHEVRGLAGHLGAAAAHRDADVGARRAGRVVDPVAGHRDHVAALLQASTMSTFCSGGSGRTRRRRPPACRSSATSAPVTTGCPGRVMPTCAAIAARSRVVAGDDHPDPGRGAGPPPRAGLGGGESRPGRPAGGAGRSSTRRGIGHREDPEPSPASRVGLLAGPGQHGSSSASTSRAPPPGRPCTPTATAVPVRWVVPIRHARPRRTATRCARPPDALQPRGQAALARERESAASIAGRRQPPSRVVLVGQPQGVVAQHRVAQQPQRRPPPPSPPATAPRSRRDPAR